MAPPKRSVLDVAEEHFGEPAGPDLVKKARGTSKSDLIGFRDKIRGLPVADAVPTRAPGEIRPYLFASQWDNTVFIGPRATGPKRDDLRDALLLTHSVAFKDTIEPAFSWSERATPTAVASQLRGYSVLAPLIRAGIVVIIPGWGTEKGVRNAHADLFHAISQIENSDSDLGRRARRELDKAFPGRGSGHPLREVRTVPAWLGEIAADLDKACALHLEAREVDFWLPHYCHYSSIRRVMAHSASSLPLGSKSRQSVQFEFASLSLPELESLPFGALVALRRDEETFAEWRALLQAAALKSGSADDRHIEFSELLREGAAELQQRLASRRASLLSGAVRAFAFGGLGSLTSATAFGVPPWASLASGAVSAGATAGHAHVASRKPRAAGRALNELCAFLSVGRVG
jgi:hypothetical protein